MSIELTGGTAYIDSGNGWTKLGFVDNVTIGESLTAEPITPWSWSGESVTMTVQFRKRDLARWYRQMMGRSLPAARRRMHSEYHRRRRYW